MKLHALSVNQFKKFTEPTALDGLGDGLNVVVGPNELGKSTLLDALRAALFQRHRGSSRPVRELQNDRNRAAPVVRLEFEVDDSRFTISKRFVKRPYARLEFDDGRVLQGDDAEDQLRELLGFSEGGGRTAVPGADSIWGVLWVAQGASFGPLDVPETAHGSLGSALEAEVGAVLGGRRGRELPNLVEQQLKGILTEKRREPTGDYRGATEEVEQLKAELEGEQERRSETLETIEHLAAAEDRLSRLNEGGQESRERAELKEAEDELLREREREAQIEGAVNELELRDRDLDAAREAVEERVERRRQLDLETEALARLRGERENLEPRNQSLRDQLKERQKRVESADKTVVAAEQAEARQRAVWNAAAMRREIAELEDRKTQAQAAVQQRSEARQTIETILVNDDAIERIDAADLAVVRATAQLRAAATTITFEIPSDRRDGITVDGSPLPEGDAAVQAVEQTIIVVPERGRIIVDPAITEREALVRAQMQAETELREALADAGAKSLADARALGNRRRSAERVLEQAEREIQHIIPDGDMVSLGDRIAGLRQRFDEISIAINGQDLPSVAEAEAAAAQAAEAMESARSERAAASNRAEEARNARTDFEEQIALVQAKLDAGEQLYALKQQELDDQIKKQPDDHLAAAVNAAETARETQQQVVDSLTKGRDEAKAAQLSAQVERLQKVLEQRGERRIELTSTIDRLKGQVEAQDAAGIDERIEQTSRRLELARERLARFERDAEVLTLLLDTLRQAESEAKELYLAPVLDRVRPYLQMLFPDAQLEMDEDLQITGIRRNGDRAEPFGQLSKGTQEQIAVLVRLAFAEMLVEQGRPAAVVLDDALVFSDDQRMLRMFDILHHAGRKVQIVVFTCREQLFDGLGARRLTLTEGDAEQLASA